MTAAVPAMIGSGTPGRTESPRNMAERPGLRRVEKLRSVRRLGPVDVTTLRRRSPSSPTRCGSERTPSRATASSVSSLPCTSPSGSFLATDTALPLLMGRPPCPWFEPSRCEIRRSVRAAEGTLTPGSSPDPHPNPLPEGEGILLFICSSSLDRLSPLPFRRPLTGSGTSPLSLSKRAKDRLVCNSQRTRCTVSIPLPIGRGWG